MDVYFYLIPLFAAVQLFCGNQSREKGVTEFLNIEGLLRLLKLSVFNALDRKSVV